MLIYVDLNMINSHISSPRWSTSTSTQSTSTSPLHIDLRRPRHNRLTYLTLSWSTLTSTKSSRISPLYVGLRQPQYNQLAYLYFTLVYIDRDMINLHAYSSSSFLGQRHITLVFNRPQLC